MQFYSAANLSEAALLIPVDAILNTLDAEHVLTRFHDPKISEDGLFFVKKKLEEGVNLAIVSDNDSQSYKYDLMDQLPSVIPVFTAANHKGRYKAISTTMFKKACEYFITAPNKAVHIKINLWPSFVPIDLNSWQVY